MKRERRVNVNRKSGLKNRKGNGKQRRRKRRFQLDDKKDKEKI